MIEIGKIVKPQGIKGELKVVLDSDFSRLSSLKKVYISGKEFEVQSLSFRDALYLKLFGVENRNEAELLRGESVFADEESLLPLEEGEFYFKDLIGLKVVDQHGEEIGKIEDIEQYGAADIIVVRERNMLFSVPFLSSIFLKIEGEKAIVSRQEYDNLKING